MATSSAFFTLPETVEAWARRLGAGAVVDAVADGAYHSIDCAAPHGKGQDFKVLNARAIAAAQAATQDDAPTAIIDGPILVGIGYRMRASTTSPSQVRLLYQHDPRLEENPVLRARLAEARSRFSQDDAAGWLNAPDEVAVPPASEEEPAMAAGAEAASADPGFYLSSATFDIDADGQTARLEELRFDLARTTTPSGPFGPHPVYATAAVDVDDGYATTGGPELASGRRCKLDGPPSSFPFDQALPIERFQESAGALPAEWRRPIPLNSNGGAGVVPAGREATAAVDAAAGEPTAPAGGQEPNAGKRGQAPE